MSIYRGAGGAGDAVADSSSEALLVRELAIEVQADADAAAASATAAANSASTASTAATNAQTAETNAETAETNAETAEANAETAQAAAEAAQLAAETAQTAAELAETNAETAETNAETAASSATSSASSASTSATNAASSASAASTSATNASNSASAASTSASNASTSATAAASSASAASTSASNAATSETNAAASASSASTSATTATTQAGIATTQASNAASSASAASTSASNASSSASAASTSASNAATSATNAGNSATAAATSETNAAASAAAAAASYDNFDDRYLGSKSAAPTLDNDGNALVTGALYYNDGTVTPADKGMYVYDGTQWIAASAASTAILTVFRYTATASQTTFTGADDNSLTLTYTAGSVLITVNGAVMEVGVDVTASNGTSIVLAQASLAGDEVNIYAFATFNIANTYTQAQVDAGFLPKANPTYTGVLTGAVGSVSAPAITTTGDTNTGIYFPAADTIAFTEGGVEAMRLDSNGGVQIGRNSVIGANNRLAIQMAGTTASGYTAASNAALAIDAGTATNSVLNLVGGGELGVYRSNSSGAFDVGVGFGDNSNRILRFDTAGVERMRITSAGVVELTSGQLKFPATQSASSDANTLDDYEEGTWTPSIAYETPGTSSITFSNRSGQYVKIGKVVYFTSDVRIASFSKGTASGPILMTGLPFAANASGGGYENARCTPQLYDWTYSSSPIVCNVLNSSTNISISRMVSNSVSVAVDDPRGGSIVWITGFYFV